MPIYQEPFGLTPYHPQTLYRFSHCNPQKILL